MNHFQDLRHIPAQYFYRFLHTANTLAMVKRNFHFHAMQKPIQDAELRKFPATCDKTLEDLQFDFALLQHKYQLASNAAEDAAEQKATERKLLKLRRKEQSEIEAAQRARAGNVKQQIFLRIDYRKQRKSNINSQINVTENISLNYLSYLHVSQALPFPLQWSKRLADATPLPRCNCRRKRQPPLTCTPRRDVKPR